MCTLSFDCDLMYRGILKSHGKIPGGLQRGRGDVQVSRAAGRPVGRQPNLGLVRKGTTEWGDRTFSIRDNLSEVLQEVLLFG